MSLNDLTYDQILDWLPQALKNQEALPKLTPDESPYLGILRLEKNLNARTSGYLRDACSHLVRSFCGDGEGDISYVQELLSLASAFKIPEAVHALAEIAPRFDEWAIPLEIRSAVLAMLVDTPPPQTPAFWIHILRQNPKSYGSLALSGLLAANPLLAITMLPEMPDDEHVGEATALKLDLAWDDLPTNERFKFVALVESKLAQCGEQFGRPLREWIGAKNITETGSEYSISLPSALREMLGGESSPRARTPKLCHC